MMSAATSYGEGDVFAVPLADDGYAIGVVARATGNGVVVGYFFNDRLTSLPQVHQLDEMRPDDAGTVQRFGDLGLLNGRWPVLGRLSDWRRDDWPVPAFVREEPLTGRLLRVDYDDDDPSALAQEVEISKDEAANLPQDGLAGFDYMQRRLEQMCRGGEA